ncbi:MAG: succinate dehydrogenase assembly factor 2 [Woeseia sp.]|nr:succinate dehydrogenase assembly factor 2 [Woeseia sp.]MBT8096474.1 succinate dehydrogenase assembly factor 2 [Woeseia sp.]NNE59744.1 succinate dehydrogenase assembly factor 2 [Woeseia sp.]NNL54954.1 succinate dehydrogenase assembly factor 2 [Woeseia sp.]
MRELDVLLSGWLDRQFDAAPESQKVAFQSLLELSDPELAAYLLRGEPARDAEQQPLIEQIRGTPQT